VTYEAIADTTDERSRAARLTSAELLEINQLSWLPVVRMALYPPDI
jgi:hypothetical protein